MLSDDSFQVFVRVRPPSGKELQGKQSPLKIEDNIVPVTQIWLLDSRHSSPPKETSFSFNSVFPPTTLTAEVYTTAVASVVKSVIAGFNATIFAYGMTGAGKTHTMFGDLYLTTAGERGLVPLALQDFFSGLRRDTVKLSYLEIYNEQVRDLLSGKPGSRPQGLMIVEDEEKGVMVPELVEREVGSIEEVVALVIEGNERRTMAATGANQFSTRSHAILQVSIERRNTTRDIREEIVTSKLCLIDLAGSERAAVTDNRGIRMLEGANINRSLLALGNCINILSDSSKSGKFVPYRDSKLTRLLKDSLGGRTRTVMIACVSPSLHSYEETLHTLKYAERARNIKVKVTRNVKEVEAHVSEYKSIISALKSEIEVLRERLRSKESETEGVDQLGQEMLLNLEEFWELKKSIEEVDTLNEDNKKQIRALLDTLDLLKSLGDRDEETKVRSELKRLHNNVKENEDIRSHLLANLQTNLKRKNHLQRTLSGLQDSERRDKLEMQMAYHALKMEKVDLVVQNQEMKQKVIDSQKESAEREKTIEKMRAEMEEMRKKLKSDGEKEDRSEVAKSVSPRPMVRCGSREVPVRSLKISNLQDARLLRKTESKREMHPTDSTSGFLSQFLASNSSPPADLSDPPSSARRLPSKPTISLLRTPGQFSNLHKVTPNTGVVHRSASTNRERYSKSPLNSTRVAQKTPLMAIQNQSIPRIPDETEKLVRKNFRKARGETPTVAISLVPKFQC